MKADWRKKGGEKRKTKHEAFGAGLLRIETIAGRVYASVWWGKKKRKKKMMKKGVGGFF